jgi:hypothetical protein
MTAPGARRSAGRPAEPARLAKACLYACAAAAAVVNVELGLVAASFIGIGALAAFSGLAVFPIVFLIAAAHLLLLGLPLYLALSRLYPVGRRSAAAAGFLVGAFPFGIFPGSPWQLCLLLGLPGLAAGIVFVAVLEPARETAA